MDDRRIERTERTSESGGLGIVLAIILTALIVGGGVLWWKSARPTPPNDQNPTNINIEIPNPIDNSNSGNNQNPSSATPPPSGGAYNP